MEQEAVAVAPGDSTQPSFGKAGAVQVWCGSGGGGYRITECLRNTFTSD